MDILMIILRVVHIFAGVAWVGAAAFLEFFVAPTEHTKEGRAFLKTLYNLPQFAVFFPVVALSTTLAGIWMYIKISDGFNADWMNSSSGIVLSIGAMAGILAMIHGAAFLGSSTSKINEMLKDESTPEATLTAALQNARFHTHISFALMVITLFCMAAARYF